MQKIRLKLDSKFYLSEFCLADQHSLIKHLNDEEIYKNTLQIPYPYEPKDADRWLKFKEKQVSDVGAANSFAIRAADGELVGACGFDGCDPQNTYRSELGYWLARPLWGRGIVTMAVAAVCQHARENWSLKKATAHVFVHNIGSQRVLEKCGFELEGEFKQHFLKDGRRLDAKYYGLLL